MSERDNWETRAIAVAVQLDLAASELRRMVDEFRQEEPREEEQREEEQPEGPDERPDP